MALHASIDSYTHAMHLCTNDASVHYCFAVFLEIRFAAEHVPPLCFQQDHWGVEISRVGDDGFTRSRPDDACAYICILIPQTSCSPALLIAMSRFWIPQHIPRTSEGSASRRTAARVFTSRAYSDKHLKDADFSRHENYTWLACSGFVDALEVVLIQNRTPDSSGSGQGVSDFWLISGVSVRWSGRDVLNLWIDVYLRQTPSPEVVVRESWLIRLFNNTFSR